MRPKASLDFARVLRAISLGQGRPWDVFNLLNVVDGRTMRKLFQRGGVLHLLSAAQPPTIARYLAEQRFVRGPALEALVATLARRHGSAGAPIP
jgi:hypothetical protein